MPRRSLLLVAGFVLGAASPTHGQQLRVEGRVTHPAADLLREVTDRASYVVIRRDTVLPADTRIGGDLVVVDADVRLEGRVDGSVVVLPGGRFFLRPGGSVSGTAANLGGGLFISANAEAPARLELPAGAASRVEYRGDAFLVVLTPAPAPPIFETGGIMGLIVPTYDRVNGATLGLVGHARLYRDSAAPRLTARALYHQGRQRFGAEASLLVRLGPRHRLSLEAAHHYATNDAWIRGDLTNSLAALFVRSDARDYHEEQVIAVELAREPPPALAEGQGFVAPRLAVATSTAESLRSRDPWTLFGGDEWRDNPAILPGRIVSATVGAAGGWQGVSSELSADASIEWAPSGVGDFDFALLTAEARWTMLALYDHSISVRGRVLHPLGTAAPPQRWSILGGPGTLPTIDAGSLRGDHLVFIESSYAVPLPWLTVPVIGSPSATLRHLAGSAWAAESEAPSLDQNLGAGLAFSFVRAELFVDPVSPDRVTATATLSLPF